MLRPTTRSPVLVRHPDDAALVHRHARPAGAAPHHRRRTGHGTLRLVTAPRCARPGPAGRPRHRLRVEANRELADQLLAAADLWLFVTTAARYADAVPWDLLQTARDAAPPSRWCSTACPRRRDEVRPTCARCWPHGLGDAPLFVVPEEPLPDGRLPDAVIAPLRAWLTALAATPAPGPRSSARTLTARWPACRRATPALAAGAAPRSDARPRLRADVDAAYDAARAAVHEAIRDGTLLRGEVLARWQEFVGTGELLRTLEYRLGRLRDRVAAGDHRAARSPRRARAALETGRGAARRAAAEQAAERGRDAWRPARRAARCCARPTRLARAAPAWATPASGWSGTGRARCSTSSAPRARTAGAAGSLPTASTGGPS